ncbi:MAG: DUF4238 domain-containing protein [Actinomycetota bacterium]|nr:DUF4238 domain-containing protein [Actinomycetota bacterium]
MNDHIVSRGWQANFTDDHTVSILDVVTGKIVDDTRRIKSNFARPDFLTYLDSEGNPVRDVDDAFTKVERKVLNRVREIRVGNCKAEHRDAVAELFGIHLVRSDALRVAKLRLMGETAADYPARAERSEAVREQFIATLGRPPLPGELETMAWDWQKRQIETNEFFVENLPSMQQKMRDMMARYHVQVIEAPEPLPGFVLGDVPVVHANLLQQRYGFRDRLALGDCDYLAAPLSRRVAVLFTAQRLPHAVLATKKTVSKFNAVTLFAAHREVLCNPADVLHVKRLWAQRDRFRSSGPLAGR